MTSLFLSSASMQIDSVKKVHFIGVGGIGMSGLARLFLHEGKEVSGSDRAPSAITAALEKEGVKFYNQQDSATTLEAVSDIDLVVYTEAMSADHPEMVAAKKLGVPMLNYFAALGAVANQYYLIAVAGTHGKTTTTAMLIDIFEEAGLDPTAIVGSLRSQTGSNFRAGKSKYFIVEACEYRRDFLHLEPDVLIITNLETEHMDYYKDLADVQAGFRELAEKVPTEGAIVAQAADENVKPVLANLPAPVMDYKSNLDLTLPMKQPGLHNRLNAAAAKTTALYLGVEPLSINRALSAFAGTWRRFEHKGELNGAPVYDDYAHHPTEVRAAIAGARELYSDKKLVVVFQPHLYTRTAELFDDFVDALATADQIIVTHIYDARNTGEMTVTGQDLVAAVKTKNPSSEYLANFDDIENKLQTEASADDVILIMGAGNVTELASRLTN